MVTEAAGVHGAVLQPGESALVSSLQLLFLDSGPGIPWDFVSRRRRNVSVGGTGRPELPLNCFGYFRISRQARDKTRHGNLRWLVCALCLRITDPRTFFLILAQILRPVTGSVRCHLLGIKRVVVSTEATSDNGNCRDLPLAAYGQESAVKARFS